MSYGNTVPVHIAVIFFNAVKIVLNIYEVFIMMDTLQTRQSSSFIISMI